MTATTIYIGRRDTYGNGRPMFSLRPPTTRERPEPFQYLASLAISDNGTARVIDNIKSNTRKPEEFYDELARRYANQIKLLHPQHLQHLQQISVVNGKRISRRSGELKDCLPLPHEIEERFRQILEESLGDRLRA